MTELIEQSGKWHAIKSKQPPLSVFYSLIRASLKTRKMAICKYELRYTKYEFSELGACGAMLQSLA